MFFGIKVCSLLLLQSFFLAHSATNRTPRSSCRADEECKPWKDCPELQVFNCTQNADIKMLKDRECGSKKYCCPKPGNFLPETTCGKRRKKTRGREAGLNEFPWMAMLLYLNDTTKQMETNCGGSLINQWFVLTAAHCADGSRYNVGEPQKVRLGAHYTEPNRNMLAALPIVEIDVNKTIKHESYYHRTTLSNDIALLQLKFPVRYSVAIQPICLPTAKAPTEGRIFEVAGWGNGSRVLVRKFLKENRHNETRCKNENFDLKSHICAGGREGGDDTCKGDSGGPLMATNKTENKSLLAGIISFGQPPCGQKDKASFYTDTRHYLDWIKMKLEEYKIQENITLSQFKCHEQNKKKQKIQKNITLYQFKCHEQNKKKQHYKYYIL